MTRTSALLPRLVWPAAVALCVFGCDGGEQPAEPAPEPAAFHMPRVDIRPEPPVAVVYTQRWIDERRWIQADERPIRQLVQLAIWADGMVIWSSYTVDADERIWRRAEIAAERVEAALDQLASRSAFDLDSGKGMIRLHADHDVILIDAGPRRRLHLAGQPHHDVTPQVRERWRLARAAFEALVPDDGQRIDVSFAF